MKKRTFTMILILVGPAHRWSSVPPTPGRGHFFFVYPVEMVRHPGNLPAGGGIEESG